MSPRGIELDSVQNVRDLGGIAVHGDRTVRPGLLFRGGHLSSIADADRRALFIDRGINCVIDLRCGWECDAKPAPAIHGVEHHHVPFYDLEKVGIEYTEPGAGTRVVGRDVACDPLRFYPSLVNPLTVGQMRQAVGLVFAQASAGHPVFWHCSGGKDRAGVLSVLVLSVLGAARHDILQDYLLTNESRDKQYEQLFARFLGLAAGDEVRARELVASHRARPEYLDAFYAAIDDRCGGMERFIRNQLRINEADRERIREACTVAL